MTLENGATIDRSNDSSTRFSKKRRNGRKNGGAKIWAAACDDLHASNDEVEAFEEGALVWARIEQQGFWWPAFVPSLESLPLTVLRKRQEGWVCVKFYEGQENKDDLPNSSFVWLETKDIVLFNGEADDFCHQVIPESNEAGNFHAALLEVQKAFKVRAESSHVARESSEEDMGKLPATQDQGATLEDRFTVGKEGKHLLRKRKSSQDEDNSTNPGETEGKRILKLKITRSSAPQDKEKPIADRDSLRNRLGPDGSYVECMVCGSGGSLLCCDHCPGVYHLYCLSPPLKRAPTGKWRCPECREAADKARAEALVETEKEGDDKQAPNGDILNVSAENSHKRNRDDIIKRFKKKSKVEDPAADKCPPCGLNKQSSETFLDNGSSFGQDALLDEGEELNSTPTVKGLPSCASCGNTGGSLLKCCRCGKSFHHICLDTPIKKVSRSRWLCSECSPLDSRKRKEDQFTLPAASHEVDRIVGCRRQTSMHKSMEGSDVEGNHTAEIESTDGPTGDTGGVSADDIEVAGKTDLEVEKAKIEESTQEVVAADKKPGGEEVLTAVVQPSEGLEYLVKWIGKSHVHNEWISESSLKSLAKRKLENYKSKHGTIAKNLVDERWLQPQRIIARRKGQEQGEEVLVKWCSLPYDECTWERLDSASVVGLQDLLATFQCFENEAMSSSSNSEVRKAREGQVEVEVLKEQPPELQGGQLFPHQMEALNWLRKCWHKKKNVILADEMGLGKTISACAFLSSLHHEFKVRGPCLVLVPLSTMPNWMAEFALWAPDLNVIEYHGSVKARAVIRQYEWYPSALGSKKQRSYKFKVMLTNYETVINDPAPLRSLPWEALVVDEGHRLKNSGSKLFTLLNTFTFAHRVLMTGTPMQNNLGEMYNLLNFLQPEKFPSLVAFQESFSSLSTAEQVEEIRKLVTPHMLRRLKKDAMQGIPPKAERVVLVELSAVQSEYYRALLTKNYQLLRQGTKSQQSMINIIMQLRKVCNHPYLIPGTEPESGTGEFLHEMRIKASAKLTLLHTMLGSLKKEGHRVLIFSQMTKLLDILEDYLTFEFGHDSYERVDGSVPVAERQAAIRRFNKDTSRFVFLLSTRSCGLGINLATADTVVIYDSDFNPHADIQAMNRAHRIGQSKKLLVYRLLVRGSVEERILHLAKKKLELEQLFAGKSGSQKEIEDILQWGAEELFGEPPEKAPEKAESPAQVAQDEKPKKKSGGLGDVYNDKCHESGRSKVAWDDAAIRKLLDRSSVVPDSTEADGEGDMLGSIKAWDANEQELEATEEQADQGAKDSTPVPSESKIENEGDNKWERLLRIRWEKLQSEEEAVLGRGKRQRKVISYNECAVQKSKDVSSDSDEEEPELEYTPAGQALKLRLAKLRAKQKARIALRYAPLPLVSSSHFRQAMTELKQSVQGSCPDLRPPDIFPGNLLPPIGDLNRTKECFPLPEPVDEALMQKALASRLSKMVDGVSDERLRVGDLNLFPGSLPPSLPDGVSQASALRHLLPPPPPRTHHTSGFASQGLPVHFDNPSRSFLHGPFAQTKAEHSETNGRLREGERSFPIDLSGMDSSRVEEGRPVKQVDLNKDVASKRDDFDVPSPRVPLFEQRESNLSMSLALPGDGMLYKLPGITFAERDGRIDPSVLQREPNCISSFKKDGSRSSSSDTWTEEELDALWIGVRRYGRGNWMSMLQDSKLCFSKRRTAMDLAERWQIEEAKLFRKHEGQVMERPSKPKRDRRRHKRDRPEHGKFSPYEYRSKASMRSEGKELSKLVPNFADFNFPERPAPFDMCSSHLSGVLENLHDPPPGSFGTPAPPLPSLNFSGDASKWSPGVPPLPLPPLPSKPTSAGSSLPSTEKPSKLPHWLKDAFSVAPAPEASLSPHVAAVAQAVSILHKNQRPLLSAWTQSWHPLVPPRDLPKRKKKEKHRYNEQVGGVTVPLPLPTPPLPQTNFGPGAQASGTHFPPVQLPSFSFSKSLLEPLPLIPPVPLLSSDSDPKHRTSSSTRAAPFFPEFFPPSYPPLPSIRSKYLESSNLRPEVPQFLPQQQQHNFGSSKHRHRDSHSRKQQHQQQQQNETRAAELPPWLMSAATLSPATAPALPTTTATPEVAAAVSGERSHPLPPPPSAAAAAAATAAAAADGDSSSDTHSDPDVRKNGDEEVDDFLEVSSEGTVSDNQR